MTWRVGRGRGRWGGRGRGREREGGEGERERERERERESNSLGYVSEGTLTNIVNMKCIYIFIGWDCIADGLLVDVGRER